MRTIKFRGKSLETDDWVYGFLADGNLICTWDNRRNAHEVLSTTVGQFTGILDEYQHDIYDGDIIKIVEEFDDENVYTRIGVVCFEEGMYELQDKNGKHFAYLGWLMHDDAITKLEVIGNIHDNPEMLEKGGKK